VNEQKFAPHGSLALNPSAFGLAFGLARPPENEDRNGFVIIGIYGPLMNREDLFFDSYEGIRSRVAAAMAKTPRGVVLALDSPGGQVAGLFETVRSIRQMADRSKVPLYAFVENQATSAAYALACATQRIGITPAASVGSIGVIDSLIDATDAQKQMGLRIQLITSGNRKSDGGSGQPSYQAINAAGERVSQVADLFFDLVSQARGVSVEDVRAMDAGILIGQRAVDARLADQVTTLDEFLAAIDSAAPRTETVMADDDKKSPMDEVRATLKKMAEGDSDEAKRARKALAALDEEPHGDEGNAKKAEEPPAKNDAKAKDAPPPAKKDDDGDDAKAIAKQALAHAEAAERNTLLATRHDFGPEERATLESAPLAVVRNAVKSWPKRALPKPAAAATATGTRGEGQGEETAARLPPAEKRALDLAMGLIEQKPGIEEQGNRLVLGAMVPVKK